MAKSMDNTEKELKTALDNITINLKNFWANNKAWNETSLKEKEKLEKNQDFLTQKILEAKNKDLIEEGNRLLHVQKLNKTEDIALTKRANQTKLFTAGYDASNRTHFDLFKKDVEHRRTEVDFQKKRIKETRDLWYKEKGVINGGIAGLKGYGRNMLEGFFKNNDVGKIINLGSKLFRGKDLSEQGNKDEKKLERDEKKVSNKTHEFQQQERSRDIASAKRTHDEEEKNMADALGVKKAKPFNEKDVKQNVKEERSDNTNGKNVSAFVPPRISMKDIFTKSSSSSSTGAGSSASGPSAWLLDRKFIWFARRFAVEGEIGKKMWNNKINDTLPISSLRKDGLRDKIPKVGKIGDFMKDNKGGTLALIGSILLLVGGFAFLKFLKTGKSEFLTDSAKIATKGIMLVAKAAMMPFTTGMKVLKTIAPNITKNAIRGPKVLRNSKAAFLKVGKKVVTKGAGAVGKVLGKTAGKVAKKLGLAVLKKIPGLGFLISIPFAINRFRKGDWKGGLLELASGGASSIPIIGTALSIAIDLFSLKRDMDIDAASSAAPPPLPKVPKNAMKKMLTKPKAFMKEIDGDGTDKPVTDVSTLADGNNIKTESSPNVSVDKQDDNTIKINVDDASNKKQQPYLFIAKSISDTLMSQGYARNIADENWLSAHKKGVFSFLNFGGGKTGGIE